MVYDREMGVMRLLLTAPLPRGAARVQARRRHRAVGDHLLRLPRGLHPVRRDVRAERLAHAVPALIVSGVMLGSLWLFLSVYIKQVENFAGAMNFVMFPMFFFSSALYPLWKLREGGWSSSTGSRCSTRNAQTG